ncbi:protein TolQ [gamma proteobacterium HTCC5015]|nr:protein TolQ [gamma proteobacterium HTCC5015]
MEAHESLSIVGLIWEASFIVQLVMLLLFAASVTSWWVIYLKVKGYKQANEEADRFEDQFWSGGDLRDIYEALQNRRVPRQGMEHIFEAGYREYARQVRLGVVPGQVVEAAQRVMRVALSREIDELETRLSFLATVGSTSPYVGLFGTVVGIMNSFRALGQVQQATLSMVAPGIAEALIATAIGLLAAIPAVVAYNRFANQVERLELRYDNFKEEFAALIHRQASASHAKGKGQSAGASA